MAFDSQDGERRLRVADFSARLEGHPGGVYIHNGSGTRYLPIHPFSDEPELLARLAIRAEDCLAADAYWEIGGDVCFVEVWRTRDDALARAGLFARWSEGSLSMLNVVAVVDTPQISRRLFESVMSRFIEIGVPNGGLFRPSLGDKLVRVGAAQGLS